MCHGGDGYFIAAAVQGNRTEESVSCRRKFNVGSAGSVGTEECVTPPGGGG